MNRSSLEPWWRFSSLSLILLGVAMLVLAAAYGGYAAISWAQLGNMLTGRLTPSSPGLPGSPVGTLPPAERIVIDAIGVDSKVIEIGYKYEGGEVVWERPVHAVGHVKSTANPGEAGNVVMAGHLSSYIRGEGDVFRRLPELAQPRYGQVVTPPGEASLVLLSSQAEEEPRYVWLFSPAGRFVYQVVETRVILPEEGEVMAPTTEPILTLITCVPDYVYSHRFIAIARLVRAP